MWSVRYGLKCFFFLVLLLPPWLLVFFSRNCHDLGFCAQAASASLYFYFPASPRVAVFVLMWMETAESSSAVAWFLFWKICYANLDRAAPLNGNRYFFLIYCPCVCSCLSMLRSVLSVGMPLNYQDSWVLQEQWNLVVFSFCAPVCYQLFIKSDGCESREALYRFFFFSFKAFRKQVKGKAVRRVFQTLKNISVHSERNVWY